VKCFAFLEDEKNQKGCTILLGGMYERFLRYWVFFLTARKWQANCQFKVTTSFFSEAGLTN